MKKIVSFLLTVLPWLFVCCGGNQGNPEEPFDVSGIVLPSSIETERGGSVTLTLTKGGIKTSDEIYFNSITGQGGYPCAITSVTGTALVFTMNPSLQSGRYMFHVKRGSDDRTVGVTNVVITSGTEVDPGDATVYGVVVCDGKGVPGVAVSDGIDVTVTDSDGVYRLSSAKELGYVFMSVPGGYEPLQTGVLPKFHTALSKAPDVAERVDFQLNRVSNDNFTLVVMGDIHLAKRNNDRNEFFKFSAEVRELAGSSGGRPVYGLTLGDMTWDLYWYSNSYQFPQYLADVNHSVKGLGDMIVWHTIGNHDHDMKEAGDFDTEIKYVKDIAPTYYSFNLGKVHFIVLDNILCTNPGDGSTRTYDTRIDPVQSAWLKKDLTLVGKSAPVIVSMHAPLNYDNSSSSSLSPSYNSGVSSSLLSLFSGYSNVHFVTGHTHRILNVDRLSSLGWFEHNSGAVCATWWWSQKYSKTNIGTDGAPGGYVLWDIDGDSFKWQFRATLEEPAYQFRSYDLNSVVFDATTVNSWIPNASSWAEDYFVSEYGSRFPSAKSNKVLINVWNYNPGWKVKVVEKTPSGDKELKVTQMKGYDPLHIAAMSVPRLNDASLTGKPNFLTDLTTHLFQVQAGSPDTTLEITVTDEFGFTSTETMTRPKPFSLEAYRSGYYKSY